MDGAEWRLICFAHGVRCLGDRTWDFFLPMFLAQACPNSLRASASVCLLQNLGVVFCSTMAARAYRQHPNQLSAFIKTTVLENLAVVLVRAFSLQRKRSR